MTELATPTYTSETGGQTAPDEEAEYSRQVNEYLAGVNEGMRAYVPDSVEDAEELVAGMQRDAAQLTREDGKYRVNGVEVDAAQAETLLKYAQDGTDTWRLNDEAKAHATYILGLESYKQLDSALKGELRLTKLTPSEPNEETFARYKDEMRARLELDRKLSAAAQPAEIEGADERAAETAPENDSRQPTAEESEPAAPEVPATPETSAATLGQTFSENSAATDTTTPADTTDANRVPAGDKQPPQRSTKRDKPQSVGPVMRSSEEIRKLTGTKSEAFEEQLLAEELMDLGVTPSKANIQAFLQGEPVASLQRAERRTARGQTRSSKIIPSIGKLVTQRVSGARRVATTAVQRVAAVYKKATDSHEHALPALTERLKSGKQGARYLGRLSLQALFDLNVARVAEMANSTRALKEHNAALRAARLKRARRQNKRPL